MAAEQDGVGGGADPDAAETPVEMRAEIVEMVLKSLRRFFDPAITRDSVRSNPAHRAAFLATLEDCRPLPVVRAIAEDVRAGRL